MNNHTCQHVIWRLHERRGVTWPTFCNRPATTTADDCGVTIPACSDHADTKDAA